MDVGSGGDPFPRSDVLLDRLTGDAHRNGEAMLIDRPTIFADACNMPFIDKAFDFVVASHILEHMANPKKFLAELTRVGKAGYIETPNAVFERLHPYRIHCLEILLVNDTLVITKKPGPKFDDEISNSRLMQEGTVWFNHLLDYPQMFHVRLFWTDNIPYKIVNDSISCDWIEEINQSSGVGETKSDYAISGRTGWRSLGLNLLNHLESFRRRTRLKNFEIVSILRCLACAASLVDEGDLLRCHNCGQTIPKINGVPDFDT